jgi:hypothetical protein
MDNIIYSGDNSLETSMLDNIRTNLSVSLPMRTADVADNYTVPWLSVKYYH